ncbi:hypothetical protein [Methanobrevibacter sp. DSM 116169]|uniref:hypothetical protein n=1 Tax=Methanobrevibacter sp. DSM 116169 TaxID=3242727 RepID=UPI0038FC9199
MNDNKGQLAIEFLMLFSLILLFLITFTLPLTDLTIQNNMDLDKSLSTKHELFKIADSINQVYSQGSGSKKTIILNLKENIIVNINDDKLKADILLSNNKSKKFEIDVNFNGISSDIILNKGKNTIFISWNENSNKMEISKL